MTGRGPFVPACLALLALAAVLSSTLHIALTAPEPRFAAAEAVRPPALPDAPPAGAGIDDKADAWLATALARPLFDPRRRPAAQAGFAPAPELPRLTGTVVSASGATAIFERPSGAKALALRIGDRLDGYVVHAIAPGEATLLGPAGPLVLRPAFAPAGRTDMTTSGTVPGPGTGVRPSPPQGRQRFRTCRRGRDAGGAGRRRLADA